MVGDTIVRRMRGAFGNALVWGAGWFVAALVMFATLRVIGIITGPWENVIEFAGKAGIVGGIAGGAFSSVIGVLYCGRRLSEISWVCFGIGGAVITGLFVPVFFQAMNLLSGDGMVPMALVLDDALLTAVFGGVAAGGSLKLAQHADTALPEGTQNRGDLSGSAPAGEAAAAGPGGHAEEKSGHLSP